MWRGTIAWMVLQQKQLISPPSSGLTGMDGYGSPKDSEWIVCDTLNFGARAGLNWWIWRPSRTILSPCAMWKFPATLFTNILPDTMQPSSAPRLAKCFARSWMHWVELRRISLMFHCFLWYAWINSLHVLQHLITKINKYRYQIRLDVKKKI